ncbi:IS30 family transposase, partial [Halorhodospira sp. M38]|nr:IS30 family transposase [Halorhodospira sp. M39old]MCG5546915.1 IS30 family transposase [Halorhodospira sp. M38]
MVLSKTNACTAMDAVEGLSRQLRKPPTIIRQGFTYDRGSKMACHEELARGLKLDIWFADPHVP